MGVVFAGPGGRVVMTPTNIPGRIKALPQRVRFGMRNAMGILAQRQKELIQTGIRSGTFAIPKPEPLTIRTRQAGKPSGLSPRKPKSGSDKALLYSGETTESIQITLVGETLVVVKLPTSQLISYSRGRMLAVANFQELGFTRRGRFSKEMLAYLHILFRKKEGRGRRSREEGARRSRGSGVVRAGVSYADNVPARPVWDLSRRQVLKEAPPIFNRELDRVVRNSGL